MSCGPDGFIYLPVEGVVVVVEFVFSVVHVALKPDSVMDPSVWILTVMGDSELKGPGMELPQNFWLKHP